MLKKPSTGSSNGPSNGKAAASYSVPPVVRAIKVLRYIAAGNPVVNQARAAREIGINRTTLLRLLHTLEAEGLIEGQHESGNYVIGNGIVDLARRKISSLDVAQVASPVLARLAAHLGLSCHLGVLDGCEVLYLVRHAPNVPLVSNVQVGTRLPAHAAAMGRAILAQLPWPEVEERFKAHRFEAVSAKSAMSMAELARQLEHDRVSGLADSRSHYEAGIDSIAAPIFDHTGTAVAAINVSGPERAFHTRKGRRREIADALVQAAHEICQRMGYSGTLYDSGQAPTRERNEAAAHGQH